MEATCLRVDQEDTAGVELNRLFQSLQNHVQDFIEPQRTRKLLADFQKQIFLKSLAADLAIEMSVVDGHGDLVGQADQHIHISLGELSLLFIDRLNDTDHLTFADQRHRDERSHLDPAETADFKVDALVSGSIVDNHRFSVVGHPVDNAPADLTEEVLHLKIRGVHEADFHVGALVIDSKHQGCL